MAFKPEDYHPDWHWMSRQIRAQANDHCELCGRANGERGFYSNVWEDGAVVSRDWSSEGSLLYDGMIKLGCNPTTIVLTVHHLCDCDKRECHDPTHLVALCQRCHLNADRPHHLEVQAENRARRKDKALRAAGIVRLFGEAE